MLDSVGDNVRDLVIGAFQVHGDFVEHGLSINMLELLHVPKEPGHFNIFKDHIGLLLILIGLHDLKR